jgi:glycosyltransferase involved in cell wall biosynthesis
MECVVQTGRSPPASVVSPIRSSVAGDRTGGRASVLSPIRSGMAADQLSIAKCAREHRVVLMPSLWRESLGRVPIEAMANGIPVLASDRGALPETLDDAGLVFTIPDRCTPASSLVPTAQEVAPWEAVIEALWDDPDFEAEHRRRALEQAKYWDRGKLGGAVRRVLRRHPSKRRARGGKYFGIPERMRQLLWRFCRSYK